MHIQTRNQINRHNSIPPSRRRNRNMILMVQSPPIGSVSTVPSSQRRKSEIDSLNVARASSSFHRRPCASHCPPIYAGFLRNISTLSARGEDSVFGRDADCSGAFIADQVGDVVCRGLEKERRLTLPNNSALCRLAAPDGRTLLSTKKAVAIPFALSRCVLLRGSNIIGASCNIEFHYSTQAASTKPS